MKAKYQKYLTSNHPAASYGKETILVVRPLMQEEGNRFMKVHSEYTFSVPATLKHSDARPKHSRAYGHDGRVYFFEDTSELPENFRRKFFDLKLKSDSEFHINLEDEDGIAQLHYWVEHPLCKVKGYDNKFCLSPKYEVEIKSMTIASDSQEIKEKFNLAGEILAMGLQDTKRLVYFLDGKAQKKTHTEMQNELIGTGYNGLALSTPEVRATVKTFLEKEPFELEVEASVKEAIELRFITSDSKGGDFHLDNGQYLGNKMSDVIDYFKDKESAYKLLVDKLYDAKKASPEFSDEAAEDSEAVQNIIEQRLNDSKPARRTRNQK